MAAWNYYTNIKTPIEAGKRIANNNKGCLGILIVVIIFSIRVITLVLKSN